MRSPSPIPTRAAVLCAAALAGCNPTPADGTGGTDVAPGPFGRGVVTVNIGDSHDSANVSLVGLDGRRLSESFVSTADGLSGDVYPPTMPMTGDDVVLLDRDRSLVTWVDVRTAAVRAQLHVDDADAENPWDYLPISAGKAYVLRYDPAIGASSGDVIVIDPATADETTTVDQRIDVAAALDLPEGFTVRPARGVVAGDRAYLTLVVATPDYEYAPSRVVAIDTATDEIVAAREIEGLHDCVSLALSPDARQIAVGCSGDLEANGEPTQAHAGVAVLSLDDLSEVTRLDASELGDGVPGFFLSYASRTSLLVTVLGNLLAGIDDTAVVADLVSGAVQQVHRTRPIELGGVLCPSRVDGPAADADAGPPACFVSDAETGFLLRFAVEDGALREPQPLVVDALVGLPPRYLGQF